MPELPEVEAVALALARGGRGGPAVVRRRVERVQIDDPEIVQPAGARELRRALPGATIRAVRRRAKYLLLETSAGVLVAHLRMTGDLRAGPDEPAPARHQRLCLHLSGGVALRFTDLRRLGRVWWTRDPAEVLPALGPEPFDEELTPRALRERLSTTRRPLKSALLDQALIAGLGNIWADEALHRARLPPELPANELDDEGAARLLRGIRAALDEAIGDTTSELKWLHRDERDAEPPGRVHGREGAPCPSCGAAIERRRIGGRSTYFCPRCQPRAAPATARASRPRAGGRPRRER